MKHLAYALQLDVTRSLPPTHNRITGPGSAARLRSRLGLGVGQHSFLLLLLVLLPGTIWVEGLAQDLPVHLAVTSAESAEMTVDLGDLSDSTKFPLSSTGKWTGYLEFLGKPGTERSLGQPDLFIPFLQDANDMTFLNIRGQLQFDNTDVSEYNIGLGHRHMFQEWILGGYGYFDHRNTQLNNSYRQFTGGLELMSVDWAFRMNGYLPENKTETDTSGANVSVITPGDQIKVQVDGIVQEKALPGLDGEVGYLLPIPWKAYTAVFDETRVYAGGYHFLGEDGFESVTGPRGRVEWRAYDLPVLGPGSRFMMGVEAQWDEARGEQAFGLASLRIPFDVFSEKSKRRKLTGLDRRMLQPVIRDVDVVTSERDLTEILPALNEAGEVYTKFVEVDYTDQDALQAVLDDEANQKGPTMISPNTKGDKIDLAETLEVRQNQTLAGDRARVGYVSQRLGPGTVRVNMPGATTGLMNSTCTDANHLLAMASNSEGNGLTLDATGCGYGTRITGADTGIRYLANMEIRNARRVGAQADGTGHTFIIRDSMFIGNGDEGREFQSGAAAIKARRGGRIEADNLVIRGGGFSAAVATHEGSYLELTNSIVDDHHDEGVIARTKAKMILREVDITRSTYAGVSAKDEGWIEITDSRVSGTRKAGDGTGYGFANGVDAETGSTVIIENVDIFDNEGWGSSSWGYGNPSTFVKITNSRIYNNGLDGLSLDDLGRMEVDRVTITGNGEEGVHAIRGSHLTITNSLISGNGSHGLYANTNATIEATDVIVQDNRKVHGGYEVLSAGGNISLRGNIAGPYLNITSGQVFDLEEKGFNPGGDGCLTIGSPGTLTVNDVDAPTGIGVCP